MTKKTKKGVSRIAQTLARQRSLEPKPAQSTSTAEAETVLLFSKALAAQPGERKHMAATSQEHRTCCFTPQHCKGKDLSGFQQGVSMFAL